jgi:hypothetical protein
MQTKCVTYTTFNADYLAVPNNLPTHTGRADLLTSIYLRAHPRDNIGLFLLSGKGGRIVFYPYRRHYIIHH